MQSKESQKRERKKLFEETTLQHLDALYATALRLCRNERDAEDLVQETYLKGFKYFHQYTQGTNCRAWLFKILRNTFINSYRRKVKEREILQRQENGSLQKSLICPDSVERYANPEKRVMYSSLGDDVVKALDGLRPEFRIVVVLSDLQGFSYKEIAAIMEIPIGTVMSRLFRARRTLRGELHQFGIQQGYLAPPVPLKLAVGFFYSIG